MRLDKLKKNKENELNKEQERNLFRGILLGEDVLEDIKTSRGDFTIKFPRAKDLESIGKIIAQRLNGIAIQCFDNATYNLMMWVATLDVVIISGPDWYELAKKKNPYWSWREVPSVNYIQEVYTKVYEFRQKVQTEIDENQNTKDTGMDNSRNDNDSNQSGLFDELSGEN